MWALADGSGRKPSRESNAASLESVVIERLQGVNGPSETPRPSATPSLAARPPARSMPGRGNPRTICPNRPRTRYSPGPGGPPRGSEGRRPPIDSITIRSPMNRVFWLPAILASLVIGLTLPATQPARAQDVYLPGAETIPPPKDSTLTIRVHHLAPGVFAAKVNFAWTGWVELADGILVIDATPADSAAAALADTIAARSPGKKIRYLVLTHDRVDHMGGARRFLDA